jgi:hypothetical protein
MAEAVPQKIRRIPSSDLRNLVHYNKERPRSTPITDHENPDDESTFTRYVRPASVVPRVTSSDNKKDIRVETTPLLGEVKEYVKIII